MNQLSHRPAHKRRQQGFSLIEVLVATLVVALGVLTMIVMQVNITKVTKTSEVRAMGALLVGDIADRMRANRLGFLANAYQTNETLDTPQSFTDCAKEDAHCDEQQMASQDLSDWLTNLRFALPNGTARIAAVNTNADVNGVDLWLIWTDPEDQSTAATPDTSPSGCPKSLKISVSKALVRCMYFRINI